MEINAKRITLGSIAGAIILVATTLKSLGLGWADVGWKTPEQHAADIDALRQEFVLESSGAQAETDAFRTEWRCSEWAEDLTDLYEKQQAGDTSQRLKDRIEDLRDRMDQAGCDKYEDY
jgi:hypothetical protein